MRQWEEEADMAADIVTTTIFKWRNERSDYSEFSSEFGPALGQIPGTL
jgi:hypothetical protein